MTFIVGTRRGGRPGYRKGLGRLEDQVGYATGLVSESYKVSIEILYE